MPSGGHNKFWTEELVESEIRKVSEALGHFPSNTELQGMKRGDLSNIITKRGGFIFWAEKTGIARIHSDSDTGWIGEKKVQSLFISQGYLCDRPFGVKYPFDLLVNSILRIDVKSANFASYGVCKGWFYRIGKTPQADIVLCYQLDTGSFYAIPWYVCPTSNITISINGGKYADYKDNWTLIEKMIETRKSERDELLPQLSVA